jgi:hypothetical protein
MYNTMAAGKPLLAVTDDDSELALVLREEQRLLCRLWRLAMTG